MTQENKGITLMDNVSNNELWKPIAGYEGFYSISNKGRVKSYHTLGRINSKVRNFKSFRFLSPSSRRSGQLQVTLYNYAGKTHHYISRLVAAAFLPVPPVYFIDGNPHNISADNIGYCSRSESMRHTGAISGGKPKLTPEQVQQIRERHFEGDTTMTTLADEYGVTVSTISYIIRRETYK
jgi:hypothetical protein